MDWKKWGRVCVLGVVLAWLPLDVNAQTASLLPNGKQQFADANGAPYASGQVFFYIPATTTPKNTWQDVNETTLNTNPVVLDAAGRAVIFGQGQYRQVLLDQFGNTIWDQIVAGYNGVVGSGTTGEVAVYSGNGTNVQGTGGATVTGGMLALGQAGLASGSVTMAGATSGVVGWSAQATTASYTLALPKVAPIAGQSLVSSAGGTSPLIWAGTGSCLSINSFGGIADGVTDNTAAFTATYAAANATHTCVSFGAGVYYFATGITETIASGASLTLAGVGQNATVLEFAAGVAGLTLTYTDGTASAVVANLAVETLGTGVSNYAGISLTQAGTVSNPAASVQSLVQNVLVSGATSTEYWTIGVYNSGVSNVLYSGISVLGTTNVGYAAGGTGVQVGGTANAIAVQNSFQNCMIDFVGTGVNIGNYTNALAVASSVIVADTVGVNVPGNETGLSQLTLMGNQFNVKGESVFMQTAVGGTLIEGNSITVYSNGLGVDLAQNGQFVISGNSFSANGTSGSQNYVVIGQSVGTGGVITGNTFVGTTGTAVLLQSGSANVNVQSNYYSGNGTNVNNSGTSNTIGGGSQ